MAAGSVRVPLWLGDRNKVDEFLHGIKRVAEGEGVSILFPAMILQDSKHQRETLEQAGAIEARRAPFIGQQLAAAERLVELHNAKGAQNLV